MQKNSLVFSDILDSTPSDIRIRWFGVMLLVLAVISLTSCGGSSGGSGISNDGSASTATTIPVRLTSVSYDLERDGSVDRITNYSYDDQGRIVSRQIEDLADAEDSYTVTYEYEGELLISKTSSRGAKDTHTYENGRLIMSMRHWDGEHRYTYDDSGLLVSTSGEDFLYDDDCGYFSFDSGESIPVPVFNVRYNGDKITSAITENEEYSISFEYNSRGQIDAMTRGCGPTDAKPDVTEFLYDSNNRLAGTQTLNGFDAIVGSVFSVDSTEIERDTSGKVIKIVDIEGGSQGETTTTTIDYNENGYVNAQDVVVTNRPEFQLFRTPDQSIIFNYEEKSCKIAWSSNPAKLLITDVLTAVSLPENNALSCVYPLDQFEF